MTLIHPNLPLVGFEYEAVCDAIRASGDWYEGDILRAVAARCGPATGIVVDAGAHIGNHSVWWALHGSPERILACEPMPETFALLEANLRGLPALALPLALSDRPGPVTMARDEVNRGRSRIDPEGDVPALAIRLDDLALPRVSLIKIDVEGWQAHVLRGATRTLHEHHPWLLIEDEEDEAGPMLAALGLAGYTRVERYPGTNDLWEWT